MWWTFLHKPKHTTWIFNHSRYEYKVFVTVLAYPVEAEVGPGALCSGTESPP